MKIIAIPFLVAFLLICIIPQSHAGWLIYHKPEFKGKVIDAETKDPIEGAVVVVVYKKENFGFPAGGYTTVVNVKETLTDKTGEFNFPSYTTLIQPLSAEEYASFIIYKPGYGNYPNSPATPRGINAPSKEIFFSSGIGGTGELEGLVNGKNVMIKVTFGVVELPPLKTWEERKKADMLTPTDDESQWPLLHKMIKDEDEWLWNHVNWRR